MEASTENYQLKWHSFGSHLHGCVANFHNNDFFSDVTLFTMDGHQTVAHRFILSTCSQYFHQLFKHHYKLTTSLPLIIILPPEISYKTLKVLMQYMYTGETTVSKDILESVLRGGDLLKVKGLWRPREEDLHEKKLVKLHHQITQEVPAKSPIVVSDDVSRSEPKSPELSARNDVRVTYENKHKQAKLNNKCGEKIETKKEQGKIHAVETDKISEEKKDENSSSSDNLQYLVIKEEPLEWSEVNESDMELIEESGVFHTEMTIKPEVVIEDTVEEQTEQIYSPLTCELCAETFTIPADWVKHIQSHTDMMPAKRQRRGHSSTDEEPGTFPPLHCDMCQKFFPTPAEWVHHIQNTHTEFELRLSNKSSPVRPIRINRQVGPVHKVCSVCNKKFPSHASMLIHKRTHTGEKPYMCEFCYKGFNVKSNLLRHLRTLHDKIINSTDVETKDDGDGDGETSSTMVQHVQ